MAITFRDNRIILNEADATTGWTATDGPTLYTTAPRAVESTGCLGMQVSNTNEDAYVSITSDDYSGGGSLSVWITDRASFDTTANGGIAIVVGDGTNRIAYAVGGSDQTGFRHDEGPVKWTNFQIDLANPPSVFTALSGSEASLNDAAITQVGVRFVTVAKSVGGTENCFWDIIRFADNGVGIEFFGGTSGTPETWDTVTAVDRGGNNQEAYGIIRKVGEGAFDIQGNISIGDTVGTNNTYINSVGETFIFGDRGQSTNNYYRFDCAGNGTGTTDVNFDGCTFTNALNGSMDFSDANITGDIRNSVFNGWGRGINTGDSGNVWSGNTFTDCGNVQTTGSDLTNCTYTGFTGVADDAQLFWNSTSDPDGDIDGSSFTIGSAATHAIEFPTGMTSTSITIRNCDFSGYNASNGQNDSTFNVLATTGTLTINIVGGSGNTSYKSAGATVNIVQNPVTTLITVTETDGTPIQNARVYAIAADGTGDLPYQDSVTITRSSTTATVSHTGHGLATNDKVVISGITDKTEDNGVHTITVTGSNSYTYTTTDSGSTSYTGTIISTGVLFEELTDVNGEVSDTRSFSLDQPITGWVRKSTSAPYFKQSNIDITVDSADGVTQTIQLISDE